MVRKLNSTAAEEVVIIQRIFPNPSWLASGKSVDHQKLVPTFPWTLDNCLKE